jgi:hypothetical protein
MKYAFKFSDFTNDKLWVLLRWVEMGKPINQQRSWQNNKCSKQKMETTNASLLVAFRKSKNYMMPNKILNELKNLSQLQQASHCLHFTLPKTLDPCTFEAFRNSKTLHNLATSFLRSPSIIPIRVLQASPLSFQWSKI